MKQLLILPLFNPVCYTEHAYVYSQRLFETPTLQEFLDQQDEEVKFLWYLLTNL